MLTPSWEMFLSACRVVANRSGRLPFDVDMRTFESLSSLVLELWFSKIVDLLVIDERRDLPNAKKVRNGKRSSSSGLGEKCYEFISLFATTVCGSHSNASWTCKRMESRTGLFFEGAY